MPLRPGTALGPYVIDAALGAGGMGEVYRARDTRLGREVAIKVLPDDLAADADRIRRFEREARAVAALNHPHICQIYDVALSERRGDVPSYLVLEYVDGRPFRGPMAIADVLPLAIQIAQALEAAHRRGVLHRDLKPANILVTGGAGSADQASAKLLDFGLAKALLEGWDDTRTIDGTIAGTPGYMSPEQAQGRAVDARSDIFSLGVVLHEAVSGSRAFAGNTTADVLSAVLRDDPAPLGPSTFAHIVTRCLEKDASKRYQTMGELRAALEDAARSIPEGEPSIAVLPFANLSADKENEYFSDGLAEEIINELTRIPGLKVTARTSAFAFRGKDDDIRRIAAALDVRTVLEGSVRRAGNRIRVTAQLINAADGFHLWSQRFDAELADVFAVQDEIAAAIAGALQVTFAGAGRRGYTPGVAGYEAYLKALHESSTLTSEGLARSRVWFEQALALEPQFALAHSRFAFYYAQLANYGLMPAADAMPLVGAEAAKALELEPSLADGHAMLGLVAAVYDYDWPEAERRFARATAGAAVPSLVRRYHALHYLLPIGRASEAVEQCARSLRDDPLDLLGRVRFAQCLDAAGRTGEACGELRRVLELDEKLWFTHFITGHYQLRDGHIAPALVHAERAFELAPWNPSARGLLAAAHAVTGDVARAEQLMEPLRTGQVYGAPLAWALFHLAQSDLDSCADWVERVIAERHPALFFFLRCHAQALLASQRWPGLATRLNLPDDERPETGTPGRGTG